MCAMVKCNFLDNCYIILYCVLQPHACFCSISAVMFCGFAVWFVRGEVLDSLRHLKKQYGILTSQEPDSDATQYMILYHTSLI
jgi:hypothetical protein